MAEVDEFLAHYGVLGMKWGKRSKQGKLSAESANQIPVPRADGYTERMQKNDRRRVGGDKGIEKVHQKVSEGTKLNKAREQVMTERYNKNMKVAGAVMGLAYAAAVAGPILKEFGGIALDQAVIRKKASNGEKYARNVMADKRGISNYETIRLQQNPTTGNWV